MQAAPLLRRVYEWDENPHQLEALNQALLRSGAVAQIDTVNCAGRARDCIKALRQCGHSSVRWLVVEGTPANMRSLGAADWSARIAGLQVVRADSKAFTTLAKVEGLPSLQELRICLASVDDAARLANWPALRQLRRLVVECPDSQVLGELLRQPLLDLESLTLSLASAGPFVEQLVRGAPRLRRLELPGYEPTMWGPLCRDGLSALKSLDELRVEASVVDRRLRPLLESAPGLKRLALPNSVGGLRLARTLAEHSWQVPLEELDVAHAGMGDAAIAELARREWPRLRDLNVMCNRIGDKGLRQLADCAPRLRSLVLTDNPLKGRSMRDVCSAGAMRHLRHLNLAGSNLSDAGAAAIAEGPLSEQLHTLNLEDTLELTARGFAALAGARFPRLVAMDLEGTSTEIFMAMDELLARFGHRLKWG